MRTHVRSSSMYFVLQCENKTYLQKQLVIKVMRHRKETSCTVEADGYNMDEISEVGTVLALKGPRKKCI